VDASYLNRNLINALSIVGFVSVADDAIQARSDRVSGWCSREV